MKNFKVLVIVGVCIFVQGGFCGAVKSGLDNIGEYKQLFANKRVGIIANHTSYDSEGKFIVDVFEGMDGVEVAALFGPEHGFAGTSGAGEKVGDKRGDGGVVIYSLYGKNKKPTKEMLKGVDVLVFDIQDIGSRFYTYIYTMALAMEAAGENGKKFVVLDRVNPINGVCVGGNVLDVEFASFVGLYPIAVRHGMTVGELARMINGQGWLEGGGKAELVVAKMSGYDREGWYERSGWKWIKPSPNMRSVETAGVYGGMCLFEGTNVSEGRGTDRPFMMFGAPWMDGGKVASELNKLGLCGLEFAATEFVPEASKYKGEKCFGVRLIVTDRDKVDAFWSGVLVVDAIYGMYPEEFEFRAGHFDRLCGTDEIRKAIIGRKGVDELRRKSEKELEGFMKVRGRYLLY